jgi:hypothetical protein
VTWRVVKPGGDVASRMLFMVRYRDSMSWASASRYSSTFDGGEMNSGCCRGDTAGVGVASSGASVVGDGVGVPTMRTGTPPRSASNSIVWNSRPTSLSTPNSSFSQLHDANRKIIGGVGLQTYPRVGFLDLLMKTSLRAWHRTWFYCENHEPSLPPFVGQLPEFQGSWSEEPPTSQP